MQSLEGITEFVVVAEHNSFTAAGKSLGISTAQVSRQINQLETRLFYRTTRKVTPTEEGTIFYQRCRQVLDSINDTNVLLYQSCFLTTVMSMDSWTTEQGGMTSNSRAIARNSNAELKFR